MPLDIVFMFRQNGHSWGFMIQSVRHPTVSAHLDKDNYKTWWDLI